MERSVATVALIGRSNVGKSTLFNRLTGRTSASADVAALTHHAAGTTRDRLSGTVTWRARTFTLTDTGGLDLPNATELERGITAQAEAALAEARLILFVVDVRDGLLPDDRRLASRLRRLGPGRVIVVANKADRAHMRPEAAAFAQLGLGEPWPVSATNGSGLGDLLDEVHGRLAQLKLRQPTEQPADVRLCLLGRTNVGKSSLANVLLGQARLVTSAEPHTTRTAVSVTMVEHGERFELTDTAGVRRRTKRGSALEEQSVAQTLEQLGHADVALLVTDASDPLTYQDRHLAGLVAEARCGLIVVANKWDLVEKAGARAQAEWERVYRGAFPFLNWAPVAFTSATTGQGVRRLLSLAREVQAERRRTITDAALSRVLKQAIARHRPLAESGRHAPFLSDFKQVGTEPPRFQLQVRASAPLAPTYVRYLQNELRAKFGFTGTPIHVELVQRTLGGGPVKRRHRQPGRRH